MYPDFSETKIYPAPLTPEPDSSETKRPAPKPWHIQTLLCGVLCAGVLLCKFCFPAAVQTLDTWIIGTGTERIQVALTNFGDALSDGAPIADAIAVFCDEITAP